MPNRAVHDVAGTAAGGLLAVLMAGEQPNERIFAECLGGCVAGLLASRLPDKIDPPVCPNHRDVGHAVLVAGGGLAALWAAIREGQEALRSYAGSLAEKRAISNSMSDFEKFCSWLLEMGCRFLAGAIAGAVGGYGSHLALDAGSPQGLPLLCRDM
jgi:hypothetical protein